MKRNNLFFTLLLFLIACGPSTSIDPDDHLTISEKEAVKKAIIRYVAKPSDDESNDRFASKHDVYYNRLSAKARLEYYTVKDQYHYFLMSLPAPSMTEKRHATAGRFKLDDKGELTEYEEIFRTWKMKPEELKTKSEVLFNKLIEGQSLEKYYAKNAGDQYIEFPDDRTYYDKEARAWKTK